jgi:hypothetical protein
VDSGTLNLNVAANEGYFTNAIFVVSNGATLGFLVSNYQAQVQGLMTGVGGGTVLMNNGTLDDVNGSALNFPGAMFQLTGGLVNGGDFASEALTNLGTINLVGPASFVAFICNNGLIIQKGAGVFEGSAYFINNAGGVYQIQNDNGITNAYFINYGLLEKTAGTGTNIIDGTFQNYGSIASGPGSLLFTDGEFDQDGGTFQLTPGMSFGPNRPFSLNGGVVTGTGTLGGSAINNSVYVNDGVLAPGNPFGKITVPGGSGISFAGASTFSVVLGGSNQFGQLVVSNDAFLAGTLNVTLTNGFSSPAGSQFQIISGGFVSGAFSSLNVPENISITYSNNGVYLNVTAPAPPHLQPPQISAGKFGFDFETILGHNYIVQESTNLATTNWSLFTNFIGSGSPYQFVVPVKTVPQIFFRVDQQ